MNEKDIARTKSIIAFFLSNTEKLQKISMEELKDMFLMIVLAMRNCEDEELWEMGPQLFYESCMQIDLDIKEMWEIYCKLLSYKFRWHGKGESINLVRLYKRIFLMVKEKVIKKGGLETVTPENSKSNLIVMVTDHFLSLEHAPTRRILDYSCAISSAMEKKVMIVNSSGLHCDEHPYLDFDGRIFNYASEFNEVSAVDYKDQVFPFRQLRGTQPDIDELKGALEEICQLKPELVYNIGGSSLLTDLCGLFTKTACFPCSTDIPVSMSQNLFVGRKLEESDKERLDMLEPYQKVYETVINYQMAESSCDYSRSQFGISEESFLIAVVGNRLESEVDDAFVSIINQIVERADVHFLFMGGGINQDNKEKAIRRPENIHFAGRVKEAAEAVKICDLYCNPLRNGGGRSSFEALAQGVPVVTFEFGDVFYTCGEEFGVKNPEEYIEKVMYYVQHPKYRKEMGVMAKKRAAYLSDIEKTQSELLIKIL